VTQKAGHSGESRRLQREQAPNTVGRIQARHPAGATFRFSNNPTINILNGNRFMVTSRDGDIVGGSDGLFRNDTRYLSRFAAKINSTGLSLLTASNTSHYSAAFFMTNADQTAKAESVPGGGEEEGDQEEGESAFSKESLAVCRRRFIEEDVLEQFFVTNIVTKPLKFILSFEINADFEDLFEVKARAFAKKPDMPQKNASGRTISEEGARRVDRSTQISRRFIEAENAVDFSWTDRETNFRAETKIFFSQRGRITEGNPAAGEPWKISFELSLAPKQTFRTSIAIMMYAAKERFRARPTEQFFRSQKSKIEQTIREWNLSIPQLKTDWDDLKHSYDQSVLDLLFLRMPDPSTTAAPEQRSWVLLAAGCPWFMTLFGRDTLVTAYQTILLGADMAKGAVAALSQYQGDAVDDTRDEQPGKIIHELRYGDYAARSARFPYYGTCDATPLFLVVLSEVYRWTHDAGFILRHRPNAMRALDWIDRYGDIDGDGFVEYIKRSKDGLDNQCWKDSWNAIQFADGRIAEPPIATCEVQGYVYDAKIRMAELARRVWKDSSMARRLEEEARNLKGIFHERFWIDDKGCYALALDKDKRQVDSTTSNIGHLLWSGIADESAAKAIAEHLLDPDTLFSGYGVRTMSAKDEGFDPIGYHTGCVWAHDNSIIAHGLANYGMKREARSIAEAILDASSHFGYTLPEAFAGFSRSETGFPVRYPTSCSPQAWAAGAPLLLLRTLLGISPRADGKGIDVDSIIEPDRDTSVELERIRAFGRSFDVVTRGAGPRVVVRA
jgi:glycogen debranching enzyme